MYTATGTHSVSIPYLPLYHTLTTAAVQTSVFSGLGAMDTAKHFGLYPVPNVNDLYVDITPVSNPKAGHVLTYLITYKNVGTTSQSGSVSLQFDPAISYLSAAPAPSVQAGQTITWNVGTLAPSVMGTIHAQFNIPSNLAIGFPITAIAGITPVINDSTPADNSRTIVTQVTGPYDPNYKEVNIDTLYSVSTPGWLEYTIHFQNVGNDTAITVIIIDTLSQKLDLASFQIISSAHALSSAGIKNGKVAEFRFNNIMLPDSSTDAVGSMGFVKYRVKYLNTLAVNDSITNFADIYFDYNTPVRTNTAATYYVDSTAGIIRYEDHSTLVYPNPARDVIVIERSALSGSEKISLFSIEGTKILEQRITELRTVLNIENLAGGVYFVMIETENGIRVKKIVKE